MNYLQLCQALARESSTVSGNQPSSVVSQTGRLLECVTWVRDAWVEIQKSRDSWKFRRKEFSGETIANTPNYAGASLNISDFGKWITDEWGVTLYLTSLGRSDEYPIHFIPWGEWRARYGVNSHDPNRPQEWSIKPSTSEMMLGPTPDGPYTVRGEYIRNAQVLTGNTDVPICPEDHHMTIVWKALHKLEQSDEGGLEPLVSAGSKYNEAIYALERDQLPDIET